MKIHAIWIIDKRWNWRTCRHSAIAVACDDIELYFFWHSIHVCCSHRPLLSTIIAYNLIEQTFTKQTFARHTQSSREFIHDFTRKETEKNRKKNENNNVNKSAENFAYKFGDSNTACVSAKWKRKLNKQEFFFRWPNRDSRHSHSTQETTERITIYDLYRLLDRAFFSSSVVCGVSSARHIKSVIFSFSTMFCFFMFFPQQ